MIANSGGQTWAAKAIAEERKDRLALGLRKVTDPEELASRRWDLGEDDWGAPPDAPGYDRVPEGAQMKVLPLVEVPETGPVDWMKILPPLGFGEASISYSQSDRLYREAVKWRTYAFGQLYAIDDELRNLGMEFSRCVSEAFFANLTDRFVSVRINTPATAPAYYRAALEILLRMETRSAALIAERVAATAKATDGARSAELLETYRKAEEFYKDARILNRSCRLQFETALSAFEESRKTRSGAYADRASAIAALIENNILLPKK